MYLEVGAESHERNIGINIGIDTYILYTKFLLAQW